MNQPIMFLAVGPSGSGKSTLYEKLVVLDPSLLLFSWDLLRLEWYDKENYARAFELSCMDREFKRKSDERLAIMLKTGQSIFIDNTNLSKKRRKSLIEAGHKADYKVIAVVFDVDVKTLIERQTTRSDKYVPEGAVRKQFESFQYPLFEEGYDKVYSVDELLRVFGKYINK